MTFVGFPPPLADPSRPASPWRPARGPRTQSLVLLIAFLAPFGARTTAGEPPRGADSRALALADLDSPFLAVRARAIEALEPRDAEGRAANREAFRRASELAKGHLAELLAAQADRDDLRVLLDALTTVQDPATVTALRDAVVAHAETTATLVSELRAGTPNPPVAWVELGELLDRARIEASFLSRKSLSGGTGSYAGQYDVLRADRKRALEICFAVLADVEVPRPGVFPVGGYRFLRPADVLVDQDEARAMAGNAVAELVTRDDRGVLARLLALHEELLVTIKEGDPARGNRVRFLIAIGLDDVVLSILVKNGLLDRSVIDERVAYHEEKRSPDYDDAAHLRLRMGDYADAVRLYVRQIKESGQVVISSYNLACTYARWSEDPAARADAEAHRSRAVMALTRAVEHGYPDWAWLEQDRDLVAIRETRGYKKVVAELKAKFPAPSTWRAPLR